MQDDLSAEEMRAWAPRPGPAAAPDLRLPGYSGFRLIAQGGEGAVYRARQDGLGRDVAIKALQAVDPATQARFRRELEITVRLGRQHPHIVTVLDTGTLPDGRPCIVMEYYDLGSLHDRLTTHGPLPVSEVVAAGVAVADALAFAHAQGILHRDVKPQNVLVLPTSYVLADFGIARGADAGHSASLQLVSYRHAAPQMLDGTAPAAADDVWSLGSTLHTLLMGVPPFAGDNPNEDTVLSYLDRVRSADPRPLTRPDVPEALAGVIDRCLRKNREDRYPDSTTLRDALAAVATDLRRWQPPGAPSRGTPPPLAMPGGSGEGAGDSATAVSGPGAPATDTPHSASPDSVHEPEPASSASPGIPADTAHTAMQVDDSRSAEATAIAPGGLGDDVTQLPDFGPAPSPPAPVEPAPVPAPPVESRGTMTGRLADLTVRHGEPVGPEFGPGVGGPLDAESAVGFDHEYRGPWGGDTAAQTGALPGSPGVSAGRDELPTVPKLSPAQVPGFPAMPEPRDDEEAPRRRLRGFVIAGAVAAVIGVGIGFLANREGVPASAPTTTPPPPATSSTAPIPPGGDPAIAPVLTEVDDQGNAAELVWEDPTGGRAQFVLYDVTAPDGPPVPITSVAAGLTSFVVDLDPAAPEYCFQVVAIGLDDPATQRGASGRVCVRR
ncbi:serine/threonine-protein kinase [Actinokineospora fastidiosa]|uniref:non-specific serine/threonine protein kinase n=1 Tax=Actinokineospora fastidiosa TaxID=1816 RepID=A0A918GJX8_9PSEU|nr:serine/threonine-protein kinase [Actinokineospora fastidiosa]GGS41105.1 hypothetical protein GCM10010171_39640 [Actinokineospora fastidiosa]